MRVRVNFLGRRDQSEFALEGQSITAQGKGVLAAALGSMAPKNSRPERAREGKIVQYLALSGRKTVIYLHREKQHFVPVFSIQQGERNDFGVRSILIARLEKLGKCDKYSDCETCPNGAKCL